MYRANIGAWWVYVTTVQRVYQMCADLLRCTDSIKTTHTRTWIITHLFCKGIAHDLSAPQIFVG